MPLGKTIVFLATAYEPQIHCREDKKIQIRAAEPSSKTFLLHVRQQQPRQNNESAAPFFLIQYSPWLFRLQELRRIRDGDDSDIETDSVHYTTNGDLQWDDIKEGYTMQYIDTARASVVWQFQDLSTN